MEEIGNESDLTMTIGENLRKAREAAGLTQHKAWEAAGISESSYKGYEAGKATPPGDKIATLAKIFGVSTDELLLDESERTNSAEFSAIWRRLDLLPVELQQQAKVAMRGVLMGIEQEALRRAG
ncbi:helix-turn-helix transcriptional regulator [Pseudomonas gregormendelii]|uniref:Helix-turn-helix transcriptional regulator n=1 Tax=Pseudomonas gregormendelii TaxID=1628277 RepID=A0ABS3AFS5_9PSED|nr:helix-turn-helix transcriptional regulator [Pseudomonas gregormendelii]MBN3965800.1 helix-turn-helix transcriptional regulator [Pseudomonas gregormendelii]MBN3965811.1 helix-turn-helix transcriptional regulator [Pseudomonas gregormendelii]